MAIETLVKLIDDLDGTATEDVSTVHFGLDGALYEIDLTEANAQRLRDALAGYVDAGRRTGGRVKRGRVSSNGHGPDASAVREWAAANGMELAARGRIPGHITEAYQQQAKQKAPKRRSRAKK